MKKEIANLKGRISVNSRGIGFFPLPDSEESVEIETNDLKTALNRDEVEIALHLAVPGRPQTGEVVQIIERNKMQFVGIAQVNGGLFVVPDDRRMYRDILIPEKFSAGAKTGDKVLAKITKWDDPQKSPFGEIVSVLGRSGEHDTEMRAIVAESGFDIKFSDEVTEEAGKVAAHELGRLEEEIKLRRDIRSTTTFTIDPADAKDFDDALSVRKLSDEESKKYGAGTASAKSGGTAGRKIYEIGVHIADVSHYVRPGTKLDDEAQKRGLSVYLVDRTIPMLPEVLSNDLCSLNPNVPRLAFSAIFIMNESGEILDEWFGKTVIESDKRFSYEDAQAVLNAGRGEYFEELDLLNKIGKKLQAEKFKNGAIDFETEEVKFRLDEKGVPIEVYRKERLDTHKLIEEFMLLANRRVAEYVFKANKKKGATFIYRIHDLPNPDKIADLGMFLKAMGIELSGKKGKNDQISSKDINNLLKQIDGKPQESLIKTATIRSMAKAIYSTKNIGHFGLAFEYYTHFTSPIRRYPDLLVHRLLQRELTGGKVQQDEFAFYERIAGEASEKEIAASEAERNSIKYKQVEYMSKHIGEVFSGTISGVAEWGIFVEEKNTKCEGLVRLRDIGGDFYSLDKKRYAIVGEKTKKVFSLGDTVKFKVVGADLEKRMLDYKFE